MSKGLSFFELNTEISKNNGIISLWDDVVVGGFLEWHNFSDGIKIKSDDLVIDGNGHTIDARGKMRIFNISGENITLRNINFKNGFTKRYGGAIRISGSCKIIDCTFENNSARRGGDDISNGGELLISNCKFSTEDSIHNVSSISTSKNEIECLKQFISNVDLKQIMVTCNISVNVCDDENKPINGASLSIGRKSGLTTNDNGNCNIYGVNEGEYKVVVIAKGFKTHVGNIVVSSDNTDFLINLSIDDGSVQRRNFKYLDDLIHSGVKEIVLDSDIFLDDGEKSEYGCGIKLYVNDLIIDGNGHTIDAQGKTRIFYCSGKNITIKNIRLKNGFTRSFGGAIYNSRGGELTVSGSSLTGNTAKERGGAIYNEG